MAPAKLPRMRGYLVNPNPPPTDPKEMRLRREIADVIGLWDACRPACQRAGACRGRSTVCFDEQRPSVIECMTAMLYEGYLHLDGREIGN